MMVWEAFGFEVVTFYFSSVFNRTIVSLESEKRAGVCFCCRNLLSVLSFYRKFPDFSVSSRLNVTDESWAHSPAAAFVLNSAPFNFPQTVWTGWQNRALWRTSTREQGVQIQHRKRCETFLSGQIKPQPDFCLPHRQEGPHRLKSLFRKSSVIRGPEVDESVIL